ncbi:MAG TPA: hypothetical protein VH234_05945 [Candidatus Saccharimonadales bacterium]|nr:hypothetical protein [Candidatus Saccharimonadales bacterium]
MSVKNESHPSSRLGRRLSLVAPLLATAVLGVGPSPASAADRAKTSTSSSELDQDVQASVAKEAKAILAPLKNSATISHINHKGEVVESIGVATASPALPGTAEISFSVTAPISLKTGKINYDKTSSLSASVETEGANGNFTPDTSFAAKRDRHGHWKVVEQVNPTADLLTTYTHPIGHQQKLGLRVLNSFNMALGQDIQMAKAGETTPTRPLPPVI